MGLKHRAKIAYLNSETQQMLEDQMRIRKLREKHERKIQKQRRKYTKLARRIVRGIDEDKTIHITFRDRRPNDQSPIIELWDEDDNHIILLCTLVKRSRFSLHQLFTLIECDQCSYQHRMLGRELIGLRDIYLAMNDPQPACRNVR